MQPYRPARGPSEDMNMKGRTMNALILHRTVITVLAALSLAALMAAMPTKGALADETSATQSGTIESIIYVESEESQPRDPVELRRLLSTPQLSVQERHRLERALDDTYEEMA